MFQPPPTPFASQLCFAPELPSDGIGLAFGLNPPPPPSPPPALAPAPAAAAASALASLSTSTSAVSASASEAEAAASPSASPVARARRGGVAAAGPGDTGLLYLYSIGSSSPVLAQLSPPSLPLPLPRLERSAHHHRHPNHHHHNHFQLHHPHQQHYSPVAAMDEQGSHDMVAQQEAAKDYQPLLEGPLVGDKTPSDAITHEYAKADQVYVEKTMALPQTYSHYRPIQGDGNCGWRAIGFSYFEKLIETGDQGKIEGEVARLMSLNHMLSTVGGYTYFEDWSDEMTGLLRDLASNIGNPVVAHSLLHQRWNDASIEGYLIYYLRLLAATYLKANASTYDPFVPDGQGVVTYCSQSVELPNREIEHLGIVALVNVLLKPADFVLEIAYLDRSPGSQVNHHRFTDDTDGQEASPAGPVIYLLYRPDHYDILYRTPPPSAPPPVSVSIQVNRVSSLSYDAQITRTNPTLAAFSTMDFGAIAMLPGFGGVSSMSSLPLPPTTTSPVGVDTFSSSQQSPWTSQFAGDAQAHPPHPPLVAPPQPPTRTSSLTSASSLGPVSSLMAGGLSMDAQKRSPLVQTAGASTTTGYPIRFSPVQLEYEESKNTFREPTFQVKTNTFKNSVWNRAHYGNPDFHPEEWSPEEEHVDGRALGKKKGKKDREF